MFPQGVIYEKGVSSRKHGEVFLLAPLSTRIFFGFIRGIGAGLIGFMVIGLIFSFGPIAKEEIFYRLQINKDQIHIDSASLMGTAEAEKAAQVKKETEELGISSYFSLAIPKINAKSDVIANVDASSEKEYTKALLLGIAHARGTYFPGQGKRIYLFAHSTNAPWNIQKYNAVFYLLRELEKGDRVVVYFMDQKFEYEVDSRIITGPKDTSWINETGSEEELVLQTCDPPGTQFKRLLVVAKPVVK